MKKLRTIYQADIPGVGPLAMSEVSDHYAERTCKGFEEFQYEAEVIALLKSLKYDTFIDIGAAFGYFSLLTHSMGKTVIAVEAHPIRFGYLWWNLLGKERVTVLPHLVSDGQNDTSFATSDIGGLLGKSVGTRVLNTYRGETITLAEIISRVPLEDQILVKIDVEGFEKEVLDGAGAPILASPDITWLVEVHPTAVEIEKILAYFPGRNARNVLDRGAGRTQTFLIT